MKLFKQLIIGALVGFFGALLFLNIPIFDLIKYADGIVIGLYSIVVILWIWGFILHLQIKKLNNTDLQGDEEDEIDALKYRKFSDYSLFIQSNSIISLLALCIVLITTMNMTLIIIGIVFSVISYLLMATMVSLMQIVHPERNIPNISDPDYEKKLLDSADEGEKHVMLHGLYKSYNLLNLVIIFSMVGATIYSIASGNSQAFSITLMGLVLLIVHGRYMFSIRNK
ncbi:DUF3169 family protein [Pseudogracilibacillus sp. SE30717A]|uniref:DUF3169 family protein n=1 Tax=Pseudogracilibacillus sp. SE30717A TaxID=3098293 RepID=UPI00300DC1BF